MSQSLTVLEELIAEGQRQLTICNACRYCEGFCSVWPALERRHELTPGDLNHLANLCHDCRDCLDACMYAAPHEFEVNPPKLFAALRLSSYGMASVTATGGRRRAQLGLALIGAAIALAIVAAIDRGVGSLWSSHGRPASPYSVIAYGVLLVAMAVPFLLGLGTGCLAALQQWRQTRSQIGRTGVRALVTAAIRALVPAASLRNLGGGGADCTYPTETPSGMRRRLHHAVAYGFGLCVLSTVSAAVIQDIIGNQPPYPFLSVPVISGTLGGIAIAIGCAGLMWLKRSARKVATDASMLQRDYAFMVALEALALTGICVLLLRSTPVFGIILVTHLATVAVCFTIAPYSKFTHAAYRYLALVQDQLELDQES